MCKPPTIAELSKQVGLNQLKLKKGFKEQFGQSIYAYFQKERMAMAYTLLRKHNVTETATLVGYSNISHFSSAFQKQYSILPSAIHRGVY